ncbi:MAG: DUF433 domain-containing protein, partial [Balneolales bacterium]
MKNFKRITKLPEVCGGKPTIRGMRITVADILQLLSGGMTIDEILADYPYLEYEDIKESLQYGALMAS